MKLELSDEEARVMRRALEAYVSDLREEVVKTERHEWRAGLHDEEEILKRILARLP